MLRNANPKTMRVTSLMRTESMRVFCMLHLPCYRYMYTLWNDSDISAERRRLWSGLRQVMRVLPTLCERTPGWKKNCFARRLNAWRVGRRHFVEEARL